MKYFIFLLLLLPLDKVNARQILLDDFATSVKPVFIHAVYFWLHDTVTDAEKAEFISLLRSFKKIKGVKRIYVGHPAGTPRTVVDNTYDVALIVQFQDKAGHDDYQTDQIHKDAIRIFEGWIEDIRIYDMVTQKGPGMQY